MYEDVSFFYLRREVQDSESTTRETDFVEEGNRSRKSGVESLQKEILPRSLRDRNRDTVTGSAVHY